MPQQLTINLEASITQQYGSLLQAVNGMVYGSGVPLKAIAADCDMSVSELSRRLSPSDSLPLTVDQFEQILDSLRKRAEPKPIYYLVEKFLEDEESKRKRAMDEIVSLVPQLQEALRRVKA